MRLPKWSYLVTICLSGLMFACAAMLLFPGTAWFVPAEFIGFLLGAWVWLRIEFGYWLPL